MIPKIGAVILASGNSSRFGSNKLLAPFHGAPLISSVIQTIQTYPFTRIVAVTRTPEIEQICQSFHFPCILHQKPFLSDTIHIGLNALMGEDLDGCIFFQGDQPLLTLESIKALILAFSENQRYIYRLFSHGTPGSPILFPKEFFPELLSLPEDKGGSIILKKYPSRVRPIEAVYSAELLDADTPQALEQIRSISLSEVIH